MSDNSNADAEFILNHAERIIRVAAMCVISFGLADGLNASLEQAHEIDSAWGQGVRGFQDATILMAALRASLLLDRDERLVSFQTVHSRLKLPAVCAALKAKLSNKFGENDVWTVSRDELIAAFLDTYAQIDWDAHGRLIHFRNRGIAHLTVERMAKSVTFPELRTFVSIVSRLAQILQQLCQTQTAMSVSMLEEYKGYARATVSIAKGTSLS